jgi:hypothetical protein
MSDQSAVEAGGAAAFAAKLLASPGAIGVLAGALGFLFSWPSSKREGFCRIAAAGICSHFFGPGLLKTALHFAPWLAADDIQAACYLIAGLPAWWVLAWGFKWLEKRRDSDAGDVAAEIAAGTKKVKELL